MKCETKKIAIIGAGILGRMLAWQLCQRRYQITLIDKDCQDKPQHSAGLTAAGMLCPFAELDSSETTIFELGMRSLTLWPGIAKSLDTDLDFRTCGSLIIAHPRDRQELDLFRHHLAHKLDARTLSQNLAHLNREELEKRAPALASNFDGALYIANEACLSPTLLLDALRDKLLSYGAEWRRQDVPTINNDPLAMAKTLPSQLPQGDFDFFIDCRGLGARSDIQSLRGVRGETLLLHAPNVSLDHMVRLMHPRHQLYIVPRKNNHYLLGATQIESESNAPISVRSALELLSAAYSIDDGFAEASIVDARVACRPAMPDNLPIIKQHGNLIRVNGLYRHGVLTSPALCEEVIALIESNGACDIQDQATQPTLTATA